MKLCKTFILLALFHIVFMLVPTTVGATDDDNQSSFINSYEEDLTGDGFREHIILKGSLFSEKSNFYRDVWLDIASPFAHQWKISLEGGYNPEVRMIDLNHDHTPDLLYRVAKDEDSLQYFHQLYTLKKGTAQQIPTPKHHHIQGKFLDDFKVEIKINPAMKPIIKNISNDKQHYIEEKIYKENGELLKEKSIKPKPINALEPTLISKTKGYGLKSRQQVKGLGNDDILGEIETLWYYQNEKWIVLTTEWID